MRALLLAFGSALLLAAIAAPAASADNGGFTLIEPNSPNAGAIENVYWFVSIFAVLVFALVQVLLVLFVVRYRRRRADRFEEGADVHGSTQLELIWTAIPVAILVLIAAFVFVELPTATGAPDTAADAQQQRLDVRVVARQYSWQYEYPNGAITIDTLRVPQGVPVRLELTAPDEDVIHSWWIPTLQGKRDAIPGIVNELWFRADRTGTFRGQCTELCGAEHAKMTTTTEVVPEADFDAWLEERAAQDADGTSALGEEEWEGVCAKCHGLGGEGGIAPRIAGSLVLTDEEAIEAIVRTGRGRMPAVGSHWTEEQVDALVAYLRENPPSGQ